MKMNRLLLALTLAGFTGPFMNFAQAQEPSFDAGTQSASSVGRIGDHPQTISSGEASLGVERTNPDIRPEEFRNNIVEAGRLGKTISDDLRGTISDDKLEYATSGSLTSAILDDSASGAGETLYESTAGTLESCGVNSLGCFSSKNAWWAETEALLWFARQNSTPPLAVSGPNGVTPTNVLIGGNQLIGGNLAPGLRVNIGKWLNDDETIGIGGRVFGLFSGDSTQSASSDGSVALGVPVFDIFSGTNQTILVASDAGVLGRDTGSISVGSDTNFISAEGYGRFLLARNGKSRSDLVGGYTFLRYDNATILQTHSVDGITNATPDGTITDTIDAYGANNTFHGGHIGLLNEVRTGWVSLSTLTKVALGNMNTRSNVFGSTTENIPNVGVTTTPEGLLSGPDTGRASRDRFTFIPEIGAKLRLDLTNRLNFSVGYTLIVLPDVGLGSDLINTTIDSSGIIGLPQQPGGILRDQMTYIQGVDLGLTMTF
jgi:hypothetical protein